MYIQLEGFLISFIVAIPVSVLWVYLIDHQKRTLEKDQEDKTNNT